MPLVESGVMGEFPYAIWYNHRVGHNCGYLGVPRSHPWYGLNYNYIDCDVHGGLTYSTDFDGKPVTFPMEIPEMDIWWVGFDCGHAGDKPSPEYLAEMDKRVPEYGAWYVYGETYKSADYVRAELEDLARQAAEVYHAQ